MNTVYFTFGVIVCEQLDVELFGEGGQIRRHHAAGGQVHLVTAGLHLLRNRKVAFISHTTDQNRILLLHSNTSNRVTS